MNMNNPSTPPNQSQPDIRLLFKLVMNQIQIKTQPISIRQPSQRQQARTHRVRTPPPYSPKNFRTRTINSIK